MSTLVPSCKKQDSSQGYIAVLHDVTEQQQVERERREFVANVSHELRTPLTSMNSYIEALEEGAWQDEKPCTTILIRYT